MAIVLSLLLPLKFATEPVIAFGQALKDSYVYTVYLCGNEINNQSARKLGETLKNTYICTVNLEDNQIGATGARDFGQALKDTQVQSVDLSHNQIHTETAMSLKKFLPGIMFIF